LSTILNVPKVQKKVQKIRGGEGRGGERRGEEGRGGEGGELSLQCLRPSTSLMAAGKNVCYFWNHLTKPLPNLFLIVLLLSLFKTN
jgi:hypothetical protein